MSHMSWRCCDINFFNLWTFLRNCDTGAIQSKMSQEVIRSDVSSEKKKSDIDISRKKNDLRRSSWRNCKSWVTKSCRTKKKALPAHVVGLRHDRTRSVRVSVGCAKHGDIWWHVESFFDGSSFWVKGAYETRADFWHFKVFQTLHVHYLYQLDQLYFIPFRPTLFWPFDTCFHMTSIYVQFFTWPSQPQVILWWEKGKLIAFTTSYLTQSSFLFVACDNRHIPKIVWRLTCDSMEPLDEWRHVERGLVSSKRRAWSLAKPSEAPRKKWWDKMDDLFARDQNMQIWLHYILYIIYILYINIFGKMFPGWIHNLHYIAFFTSCGSFVRVWMHGWRVSGAVWIEIATASSQKKSWIVRTWISHGHIRHCNDLHK